MSLAPFYRGDTKTYPFSFTDSNGAPISIVGKKLYFTMKAAKADPDPGALQKVLGPFADDADGQGGIGTLVLTSDDTGSLTPGKFYYDFQLVDPSVSPPHVTTVGAGTVTVLEDITLTDA